MGDQGCSAARLRQPQKALRQSLMAYSGCRLFATDGET